MLPMNEEDQMSNDQELLPCPFCGASETRIDTHTYWTGMRSELIGAEIKHWCPRLDGRAQSFLSIKGKDEADAIAIWNSRIQK